MKSKILTITLLFLSLNSIGQFVDQDWDGFFQTIDITSYQGGQFRFKGYVRIENASQFSSARLWVRVDKKNGNTFNDNMYKRPILSDVWAEYLIEGPIAKNAISMRVGGLVFGTGKYFYDRLSLELKKKNGEWEIFKIANGDFENEITTTEWKTLFNAKGYELSQTSDNVYQGKKSLFIDASSRDGNTKFIDANGIKIHYQAQGKGDTILLLHGNSESLKSFNKQIPKFSESFYVIAMDSRGQGYSTEDGKQITYELMAEDVNSFLNNLKLKNINILGWSDGGNIGLILAMKHPDKVKRLAIMGANLYNDKTSVEEKLNKMLRKEREDLIKENLPGNKFRIRMIDLMLNEPKINPDDLKEIKCPTLVMAGSKDVVKEGHTKLIASKINKSRLVIFEKGTHYEPIENPERFNKTVLEFFKGN